MRPSYEELESKYNTLEKEHAELKKAYVELKEAHDKTLSILNRALQRIAELEERLNKNSKNSSKPPSSDIKANTDNKPPHQRPSRPGANRKMIPPEQVDQFVPCTLTQCPCCGSHDIEEELTPVSLQQVDLPEVKPTVTQYDCKKYKCRACSGHSIASLPPGVPNSSFGPRLMAMIVFLTGRCHLAKREAIELLKEFYKVDIAEGSIINIEERVATALEVPYERIQRVVTKSIFCKHFDESTWRNRGKTQYIWVAGTQHAVFFRIDPHRSAEAFKKVVGELQKTPTVTDRYSVYKKLGEDHQYCMAHIIRDFRKYGERSGIDGEIGKSLLEIARGACKLQTKFREGSIVLRVRNQQLGRCRNKFENSLLDAIASGSEEFAKFCESILNEIEHFWVFSRFTDVDPTNNLAERDLRPMVLWRKKSYGTRSERGQRYVERIGSVIGTVKRTGRSVFTYLFEAISAFYHGAQAPYICPGNAY